jgi:hypothetical protein
MCACITTSEKNFLQVKMLEVYLMTCKGIVLMFPGPGRVNGLPVSGQPAPQLGQPLLPQQHTQARFKGT